MKGLFLLTDYPSQTVRAGEVTTIRVKVKQCRPVPEPLALALSGVPAGWKIDMLGGGQPVGVVMAGVNQDVTVQLRVEVPKDAPTGSQTVVLSAKGGRCSRPNLPLTLTVGTEAPAKLSLKSRLPSLARHAALGVRVHGDGRQRFSGKDLTVALAAQAPANFQSVFTEGFGSNEISSIPIEAGQTKDIKLKVTPPRDVKAGDYPVLVKVAAEGATAEMRVTLQLSGQGKSGALGQGRSPERRGRDRQDLDLHAGADQRRHRAGRRDRAVGHRARQLEDRVQSQVARRHRAERQEGSPGRW